MSKTHYLKNETLLQGIAASKASYCWFASPDYRQPTHHAATLEEATLCGEGAIVRVTSFEHVPMSPPGAGQTRCRHPDGKGRIGVKFTPFQHWLVTKDGLVEVARSHWRGDLTTGCFSGDHGRLTDKLGKSLLLLVTNFAKRGSWRGYSYRDEFEADALAHLCHVALKFDEEKSDNPFAFYTTTITHCFSRTLGEEKKVQNLRDDLLIASGRPPSITRQTEIELARYEPVKLVAKRGRKPRAWPAAGSRVPRALALPPKSPWLNLV